MLSTVGDLMLHKSHATASMLTSIQSSPSAASDPTVIHVLQHILVANRFWLLTIKGQPFARQVEQEGTPETFDALVAAFQRTYRGSRMARAGDGRGPRTRAGGSSNSDREMFSRRGSVAGG